MSLPTKTEFVTLSETVNVMRISGAVTEKEVENLVEEAARLRAADDAVREKLMEALVETAVLKSTVKDWEKRWDESDRRRWTVYGVMLAAVLTFVANLTLLLLRR